IGRLDTIVEPCNKGKSGSIGGKGVIDMRISMGSETGGITFASHDQWAARNVLINLQAAKILPCKIRSAVAQQNTAFIKVRMVDDIFLMQKQKGARQRDHQHPGGQVGNVGNTLQMDVDKKLNFILGDGIKEVIVLHQQHNGVNR